jgi:3-oxoacyl-[acyl-carrier protein] reductase
MQSQKVVVVTGAAAGIGRATAQAFAATGAHVVAWDVRAPQDVPAGVTFAEVDVTRSEGVANAVQDVIARHGHVDVLVNNAGIVRDGQLVKWKDGTVAGTLADDAWAAVLDVNLKGVFLCTRAVVPHMIANGGGVVLNASSVVGLYGNFGQTNYAATKAGVIAMTQTWARELGRHHIRVNAVAPGFIATEMVQAMPAVSHTPLGRLGRPEDVAAAYVWLASDAASFVHGTVLSVDGGLVLGT